MRAPSTNSSRRRARASSIAFLLNALLQGPATAGEQVRNGFVLEPASIPAAEILAGGPPRDGIPALDHPATLPVAQADWRNDERVLGVVAGGEARAYPVAILNWHELVNDTLGGEPILVSFCPLCGTGLVFDRRVAGKARRFGVSGLLYRSDLLMYDRDTESLWSQISAHAVTGPLIGKRLRLLRGRMDEWGRWRRDHPETTVLSRETGHGRDYDRSPYGGYAKSSKVMFPVAVDRRYHPKMPTLGLRIPGEGSRAYPASELARARGSVEEHFLGRTVRISYDSDRQTFDVDAPPRGRGRRGLLVRLGGVSSREQCLSTRLTEECTRHRDVMHSSSTSRSDCRANATSAFRLSKQWRDPESDLDDRRPRTAARHRSLRRRDLAPLSLVDLRSRGARAHPRGGLASPRGRHPASEARGEHAPE